VCGIAGIFGYEGEILERMLLRLRHRGPDHDSTAPIPGTRCSIGHTRLSIIDLDPRSHQPFFSQCGRYALVFNGEIYNFRELRLSLEDMEVRFRTMSDTEVLLYWLINHGTVGLKRLDGMYAFGFVDMKMRTLVLARDPIGEKPLYYAAGRADGVSRFAFASEIKALLTLPDLNRSLDDGALLDFLRFLYTAPPNTLYQGIRELPPGYMLQLDLDSGEVQSVGAYYSLEESIEFDEGATSESGEMKFRGLFEQSVERRLISDVDIGIFLSAGIDSNAILAAAQSSVKLSALRTYTLEYARDSDESHIARRIAADHGLPNVTIPFHEIEFHRSIQRIVDLFDQPFGNSTALVSDLIAREAAKSSKVCLVGDGGDELAIGYPRYKAITLHQQLRQLPSALASLGQLCSNWLPESGRYATLIRRLKQFLNTLGHPLGESVLDWSTYMSTPTLAWATGKRECRTPFYNDLLDTFIRQSHDPVRAATIVDLKSFVPFNLMQSADRTSMAHSLELRSPFLSPLLVHGMLGLPSRVKMGKGVKPLITGAFADRLPHSVLSQPKRPFNPPIRNLLNANFEQLRDCLLHPTARIGMILNREFIKHEVVAFASGRRDNSTLLWGLATLESWFQRGI
jgi:asparagine synthase (glutamine-hydrolysing)